MAAERRFTHRSDASIAVRRERTLAELATRQHGVVAYRQLVALGFGRAAIQRRLAAGRLQRLHPGVYAVGHVALRREGRWMAAVLACGEGTLMTHRAAGAAWELRADSTPYVEVSVPRPNARSRPGIVVHRRAPFHRDEVTERFDVPCSSLPLTLLDLAAVLPRRAVERAFDQAEVLRLFDLRAMETILDRRAGHRGAGVARAIVEEHAIGETVTKRELEERFLALTRRSGLPRPHVNRQLLGIRQAWEADFHWPSARLVVETDGLAFHRTSAQIERDRRRDLDLTAAGWRVLRVTWRQVTREPEIVVSTLGPLILGDRRSVHHRRA